MNKHIGHARGGVFWRVAALLGASALSMVPAFGGLGLDGWTWRSPLPQGTSLRGIVSGGGQLVAVGEAGAIITSGDGLSWVARTSGVSTALNAVAWGGGRFVAVGGRSAVDFNPGSSVVATSADGITWTSRSAGVDRELKGVAWGAGQFVAVGAFGAIVTSPDGEVWTNRANETAIGFRAVTWNGSQFVAVGDGGIATSSDGVSWARRGGEVFLPLSAVAWSGTQFVAVGRDGAILTSPDGVSWTNRPSLTALSLAGVTWTGKEFVAVGSDPYFGGGGGILVSEDGISWPSGGRRTFPPGVASRFVSEDGIASTSGVLGGEEALSAVCATGALVIAVGKNGTIQTSADARLWTERSIGSRDDWFGVAWGGGRFVAVGQYGAVSTSADGVSWTASDSGVAERLNAVAWGGQLFVAAGANGTILTSGDGVTWTRRDSGTTGVSLHGVAWGAGRFVAVGDATRPEYAWVCTSEDGVTWTRRSSRSYGSLRGIVWSGTQFAAVGLNGAIVTSPDGITWTARSWGQLFSGETAVPVTQNDLRTVAWSGTQFVTIGVPPIVLTSPDGVKWASDSWSANLRDQPSAVIALPGQLVAAGERGAIVTSADATNWLRRIAPATADLNALAWNGSRLVAVGNAGTILSTESSTTGSPTITTQPQGQTAQRGANVTFSVGAFATESVRYQWQKNGVDLSGATSSTLALSDVEAADAAAYRVRVINGAGDVFSAPAALTVTLPPPGTPGPGVWRDWSGSFDARQLAYGGSRWVAVGYGGTIGVSANGLNWIGLDFGLRNELTDIAWSGREFVAVGSGGMILTSPDGLNWTSCASGVAASFNTVIWGDGQFIASNFHQIVTSPDGTTWTLRNSAFEGCETMVWNGKVYAATGRLSILSSRDGVSWASVGTAPDITSLTWGGGQFAAVGHSVMTSTDGLSWRSSAFVGLSGSYYAIAYGAGRFVAVGGNGALLTSSDGVNWTESSAGIAADLYDVAWNGSMFVALGDGGLVVTSFDGVIWTLRRPGAVLPNGGMTWGNGRFVVVGSPGKIYTAEDPVTWAMNAINTNAWLQDVIWNGTQFLAVGDSGTIAASPNGRSWTARTAPGGDHLAGVAWGDGRFVAVGRGAAIDVQRGAILTSPDGQSWTSRSSGTANPLSGVTWSGTRFVAVGDAGTVLTSPDGTNWSGTQVGASDHLKSVAWGRDRFVAVGGGGTDGWARDASTVILTSPDGTNWTPRPVTGSAWLSAVKWTGSEFVAVGDGGTILISATGEDWSRATSGTTYPLTNLAWDDSRLVVGGYGRTLVYVERAARPSPVVEQPQAAIVALGAAARFSAATVNPAATTWQWRHNGMPVSGATSHTLDLANVQPADVGTYDAVLADASASGSTTTIAAILGVSTAAKVVGGGEVVGVNVLHPTGRVFDQVLMTGASVAITADVALGHVTRMSFIDLDDDIVQLEFSGPGTLSLVLAADAEPALPVNYKQSVKYVKGHAGIVITGADERTNVSVFTVGRATAFDPTGTFNFLQPIGPSNNPLNNRSPLFEGHTSTVYDGVADLAFLAISSPTGKFGGVRAGNAHFFAARGLTGIYAPGVEFTGPVYLDNITAFDAASPVLLTGSVADARITGGDLLQANGQPVSVGGITRLKFVGGGTSHGATLPAQANKARLEQDGVEVTAAIVVNPAP